MGRGIKLPSDMGRGNIEALKTITINVLAIVYSNILRDIVKQTTKFNIQLSLNSGQIAALFAQGLFIKIVSILHAFLSLHARGNKVLM